MNVRVVMFWETYNHIDGLAQDCSNYSVIIFALHNFYHIERGYIFAEENDTFIQCKQHRGYWNHDYAGNRDFSIRALDNVLM